MVLVICTFVGVYYGPWYLYVGAGVTLDFLCFIE